MSHTENRSATGSGQATALSENARTVIERRIARRDVTGALVETAEDVFRRVAQNLAQAEHPDNRQLFEDAFYRIMASFDFLPNSPTLVNAGNELQQLSACFVLPVPDSISGIFEAIKRTALIHKSGGGTGFSFSDVRPSNSVVKTTMGVASGPITFMRVFDAATEAIKQGSTRRGANMGILSVHHPDILEFITVKSDMVSLQNFNISVAVTDAFMSALSTGGEYDLVDPSTGSVVKSLPAADVWNLIITNAWQNGDPGVVFIDRINQGRANPVPSYGPIKATNPCVTGDTLVYTSGGLQRAAELALSGTPVDVVVDHDSDVRSASHVFSTGRRPVFKLRTVEGYTLRLTADHRVMTERGWVAAEDLKTTDRIRLLSHIGAFGQGGSLDLGRIFGWLVGDGYLTADRAVLSFFGEKRTLAPMFAEMVEGKVPVGAGVRSHYSIGVSDIAGRDESRVSSTRLARIAEEHGLTRGDKHHIPDSVFEGCADMQRGFLQALFSADGTVGGDRANGLSVRLSSSTLSLLEDVQRLLLNFGIASIIYQNRHPERVRSLPNGRGGCSDYTTKANHDLAISKDNIVRFADQVGFMLESKRVALEERLAEYVDGPYREKFSVRFESLTPDGTEEVFDLNEPETHSFIANGLMVHNCGEQSLYDNDSCNLGSINLSHFVTPYGIDYARLDGVVTLAVRLLDDVVEMNNYALPEIAAMSKDIRRIGLGVMGWADMLLKIGVSYASQEAIDLAEEVMQFISETAEDASCQLALERGSFPAWDKSIYSGGRAMRNAARTTVAPTGTLSIIADCSGGIEPLFALAFVRSHYLDNSDANARVELNEVNKYFKKVALEEGFYSDELIQFLAEGGSLAERDEVPSWVKEVFVTAHDIAPEWHVRMQAAFQKHVDNSISKTINFPNTATVDDIGAAYELAFALGCNGITIYRDGSRALQVLKHAEKAEATVVGTALHAAEPGELVDVLMGPPVANRVRLPDERPAVVHKFSIAGQDGYLTVGLYENGQPGEIFLTMSKEGSSVAGWANGMVTLASQALQSGIPLETICSKMVGTRFEPAGMTQNREIPTTTSPLDYVARYLMLRFGGAVRPAGANIAATPEPRAGSFIAASPSGEHCPDCAHELVIGEGCMKCPNPLCGYSRC